MVMEGIAPALIENAGRLAGMPVAPLALSDEVALELIDKVSRQEAKDVGRPYPGTPAEELISRLVLAHGRLGRKAGKGFYDYPKEGRKRLWHGLSDIARSRTDQPDVEEVKQRLLAIQALEAARCIEEGVVRSPADADVGAYLGWGFAPWTGGPISYIDTIGAAGFVDMCRRFEGEFGPRFKPTAQLVQMAESGATFYAPSRVARAAA